MSQITAATCARCGAPLTLDPSSPTQVCAFCGNVHLLSQTRPPPTQPPRQPYSPPFQGVSPPRAGAPAAPPIASPATGLAVLAAVTVGIFVVVMVAVVGSHGGLGGRGHGDDSASPSGGGVVPAGEHLQWSSNGTSVVPARIDGDSVEYFVGRYVILDMSGDSTQTLFVGGFSGVTFERLWKAGPYGTLAEGVAATHLAVAGDRVAVTDFRSVVHVLDAATGKEIRGVRLTDRARSVCSPSDARKQVWVEVADGNDQIIDLDSGKSESGTRPAWCRGGSGGFNACEGSRSACSEDAKAAPKQAGFGVDRVFAEGSTMIATGHKEPGTRTPMVMGFDATKRSVAWTATIPSDPSSFWEMFDGAGDLASGRFFTSYTLADHKGVRLVSFDAATGARRWDVAVPRGDSSASDVVGLAATPTRVYVPHWTWLDVFDAVSGKHLGTVGIW